MPDKNKEVIIKIPGKEVIKVKGDKSKGKDKDKNKESNLKAVYCPNCGNPVLGKSCELCGAEID